MAEQGKGTTPEETFVVSQGGDNEIQVRKLMTEVDKAPITASNYKKYYEQWNNYRQIILAQIEQYFSHYVEELQKYTEMKEHPRYKNAMDNNVVPMDLYSCVIKLHWYARQIVSWKFIETEFNSMLCRKLSMALGEVKAIDIEREVLNRMSEMQKQRNDMDLEIINGKVEMMETKFLHALKNMQEENKMDRKENINILANALTTNTDLMQRALETVVKSVKLVQNAGYVSFDEQKLTNDMAGIGKDLGIAKNANTAGIATKQQPTDIAASLKKIDDEMAKQTKPIPASKQQSSAKQKDIGFVENPGELFKEDEELL